MRFDVTKRVSDDATVPSRLSDPGFLVRPASATTRSWTLGRSFTLHDAPPPFVWTINGQRFDPERSDANVPLARLSYGDSAMRQHLGEGACFILPMSI